MGNIWTRRISALSTIVHDGVDHFDDVRLCLAKPIKSSVNFFPADDDDDKEEDGDGDPIHTHSIVSFPLATSALIPD